MEGQEKGREWGDKKPLKNIGNIEAVQENE